MRLKRLHIELIVLVCAVVLSSHPVLAQFSQQGPKLVGTGAVGTAVQGQSVSLSADGNTAIVGANRDNSLSGAAWVWTRSGGVWTQQGTKLVGSDASPEAEQGYSVFLSADGNTAIIGGVADRPDGKINAGAAWVWTRSGGVWTQQGTKLVSSDSSAQDIQGWSVSLSADGNTAIVGGVGDNSNAGAAWVWTRSGGVWTQQGTKLVGSGAVGNVEQGYSVSLSADGNTAIIGGPGDNSSVGAAWVWTRNGGVWIQQGTKLVGSGVVGSFASQGQSVSLSADGNTAIIGGAGDNNGVGAAWVWTRSGGVWSQQSKLLGSGAVGIANQGTSVALSADGNTAIVGGLADNSYVGAAWVWTRSGGVWSQQSKLLGSGAVGIARQGTSVALSAAGTTAIVGGLADNSNAGAAWVFAATPILLPVSISSKGTVSFTCPTGYTVIGFESFKGTYPDTSTHVSTNTLGPTLVCSTVGAGYGTMENGYLNGLVPTGDGNYWVRISKEGTAYVNTDFSGEWYYWTAQRLAGVWSIGGNPSTGTISVTTNLSAASFTISGPSNYSGSGTSFSQTNAPAGSYTITYNPVTCTTTPAPQIGILTGGGTLRFGPGNYQGQATVSVNVSPAGASGATFSINPAVPGVRTTGPYPVTKVGALPQQYTVTFNSLPAFDTPPPQSLSPSASCQLLFSGVYIPKGSLTVSTNTSTGGFTISGPNGYRKTVQGATFGPEMVSPGQYTMTFADATGYFTPATQVATVSSASSAAVSAFYQRLFVVAFTGFNNAPTTNGLCIGGGVSYDSIQSGAGMTLIPSELAGDSALKMGTTTQVFTFYSSLDGGSLCTPPSAKNIDHTDAELWLRVQNKPTNVPWNNIANKVAVIGHSYGGFRASLFVEQLKNNQNIMADSLITVDAVDWDKCIISDSITGGRQSKCDQSNLKVKLTWIPPFQFSFYQTIGYCLSIYPDSVCRLPGSPGTYPLKGYQLQGASSQQVDKFHTEIDDDNSVRQTIIALLRGRVRIPQVIPAAGIATRGGGLISAPVTLSATGLISSAGVRVLTATLNGVPATNLGVVGNLGDFPYGASKQTTLVFPDRAVKPGKSGVLVVNGGYNGTQTFDLNTNLVVP